MKSIGVDLHKCSLTAVVLDEQGQLIEKKEIPTKCRNQIQEYFASYGASCQVAVESVGFYQWFWDLVRPLVGKLVLADPAALAAFRGRKAKTDFKDGLMAASLLHEDRLPMAYVPTEPIRQLRELVRLRHSMGRSLAAERRQLRWISLKNNLPGPSTLTSDRAQKWILAQEDKLSAVHRLAAQKRLNHILALERDLFDIHRAIDQAIEADPEILRPVRLFESIPGIGRLTAITILVETGDITRFKNIDQLSAYAGLAPRVSQSGETIHHGHISKQGPPIIRWVLQQAAWTAIRTSPEARRIFTRISKKAGSKKAATALARKLLSYAWSVARRGVPFHWPGQPVPTELTDHWSYEI
jgi:transposase